MAAPSREVLIKRHALAVRLTHWLNVLALAVLLTSGLQIFNAHPALYWGDASTFAHPWLAMTAAEIRGELVGLTQVGDRIWRTTGVLGASGGEVRGFPDWLTLPTYRSLADGRRWHFFFAWVLVLNGLVYASAALFSGHVGRDLLPRRQELAWAHLWAEVADHARLRFPKGEAARAYNTLQKLAYLALLGLLLPAMVLTGLSMSPGFNAAAPWLPELFGGRQSARSIHFLCAWGIVAFTAVHLAMVVLSGFWNNLRSMITGRYAIRLEEEAPR
jgi:thiosulfate reductase cytochrome b subunit